MPPKAKIPKQKGSRSRRFGPNNNIQGPRPSSRGNTASGPTEFSGQSKFGHGFQLVSNYMAIPLFGARFKGLLRYQTHFNLTSTSGAVASYVFSANGDFDPDITSTGHQPAGFDQMMLSYEHYTVVRSRCEVTFQSSTASVYPTVAVSHRAASTPNSVAEQNIEDGLIVTTRLHPVNVANSCVKLECNANIAQFGGLQNVLDNSDYRGNIAANPAEQSYFHIQTWSMDSNTSTQICEVVLEYEVIFTEPRSLSQSISTDLHHLIRKMAIEQMAKEAFARRQKLLDECKGLVMCL